MSGSAPTASADSLDRELRRAVAGLLLGAGASARFNWPAHLGPEAARERPAFGAAQSPRHPRIAVRELRAGDKKSWKALRPMDNDRLAPWEATLPVGGGETSNTSPVLLHRQTHRARFTEVIPFVVGVDGAFAGQIAVGPII